MFLGGGAALLYAREAINNSGIGSQIVYEACGKPFEQILLNAGYTPTDAQMIGKYQLVDAKKDVWTGYNLKTGEVVDMKEAGILDPSKVTRTALENAASVAGTILLTEGVVVDHPEQETPTPDAMY